MCMSKELEKSVSKRCLAALQSLCHFIRVYVCWWAPVRLSEVLKSPHVNR